MLSINAFQRRMLALAAVSLASAGTFAVAAPSKSGGTAASPTILNPYTLSSVVVTPTVRIVSAPVVVSAADTPMSGIAPSKGGGVPAGGIPTPPGPVIFPPLPPSAPVSP